MKVALNYHCTVGEGSIVMEGSACGIGTIIPDFCIVQGVPAEIIRENIGRQDIIDYVGVDTAEFVKRHAGGNVKWAEEHGVMARNS